MGGNKTITLKEAMKISSDAGKSVTRATLIEWVRRNELGHQPGGFWGRWHVYEDKFRRFIYGENYVEGTDSKQK